MSSETMWTEASKRLPENDRPVLVWCPLRVVQFVVARWVDMRWASQPGWWDVKGVVKWQELPSVPKIKIDVEYEEDNDE